MVLLEPSVAFTSHIQPHVHDAAWVEDSRDISKKLPLSKRELFALIVMANVHGHQDRQNWQVGYDPSTGEPNDGLITNGDIRIDFEHKLVPRFVTRDALDNILQEYDKQTKKGLNYGSGKSLIIHANVDSQGMIRISELANQIGETCYFDKVIVLGVVNNYAEGSIFHATEHFPGRGITEVNVNFLTGLVDVRYDSGTN